MHINIEYHGSFHDVVICPENQIPEFAFIGRSNVGKSSLINLLFGRKDLAYVSKQPGKTQSINFFLVNEIFYVVDLPGYGYARHSKKQRTMWKKMNRDYFLKRTHLTCVFVLIDSNIPLQPVDRTFINWLGENEIPFVLVFTKSDHSKPRKIQENIQQILNNLLEDWEELPRHFITSAVNREGKEELLAYLLQLADDLIEE